MILNESNFQENTNSGVCMIDFYADWCGPCRHITPVMTQIANEQTDFKVFKVNVDNSQTLAGQFNISSIPCVLFLKDGQEMHRYVGIKSKEDYMAKAKEYL